MDIFKRNPAFKLLILIILGIILGNYYEINNITLLNIIIIASITSLILLLLKFKFIPYLFLGLVIGFYISSQINELSVIAPNKIIPTSKALIEGRIVKTLKQTDYSYRCIVEGTLDHKVLPELKNQGIILNITSMDEAKLNLCAGTDITCEANVSLPHKAILPADISEAQYAASIDVQWIANASAKKVSVLRLNKDINYYRELVVFVIEDRIRRLFSAENFGIVLALLTGDQTKVPMEARKDFSLTGTTHVLSVSGLHVGVIASVVFIFLGFVRNKWLKFFLFSILVSAFVVMTGMQPPAIRAGIMAITALLASSTQRRVSGLNIIAFSIIVIILFTPGMVYSMGFQMSAASILGIALLYNPFKRTLIKLINKDNKVSDFVMSSLAVTFSASVMVSPIVAFYFKVFSVISPIANLIIIPLYSLAMIIALLAIGVSFFWTWGALAYASAAGFLIDISSFINRILLELPLSSLQGNLTFIISCLVSLILIYILFSQSRRQFLFRLAVSAVVFVVSINIYQNNLETNKPKIYPRENYVAAAVQIGEKRTFVLISDRKPALYPSRDLSMEQFLIKHPDSLMIGYNGNVEINIVDHVKEKRNIFSFPVSLTMQERLERALHLKCRFPQIIELD